MNNWENNHCLNDAVISSPYENTMPTPEAYYSPNQNQIELIKAPTEYWYQQQQQRGISPSSSGLSREDSLSPCLTPMYNLDDTQLMRTSSVSFSSSSSHYMPLIDPMVFGNNNNNNNNNNNSATAVASIISSSQHQPAYQQHMLMPLLQHETHSNHEKLLSHYNNQESLMVPTVHSNMNTYITYKLHSPTSPISSSMCTMNIQNGMSSNNNYVSYQNGYTNQQATYNNNNYAKTIDYSLPTSLVQQHNNNQQQFHNYGQNTNDFHRNTHAYIFSTQSNVKYAQQQQQQQQHENRHNSYHQQNNHLMTISDVSASNALSPSTSSSYSNNSSSSNIVSGGTSIIGHKQNNNSNNNSNNNNGNYNNNRNSQNSFPCLIPECNKLFSRPYNLKSHMRTHTHERPYECTYKPCAWKFARPHDLKRHELQHTGQKPHGCRFCHRRFARSDALKRHWKVDVNCAQALKQETALNGGNQVHMKRKKSKKIIKQ